MKSLRLILPIVLSILFTSCTKDKAIDYDYEALCGSNFYTYDAEIRPLLVQYCTTGLGAGTGCHDSWINNYGSVANFIKNGSFQNRVLVQKNMPPLFNTFGIPPLSDSLIKVLECWILSGYPKS
jgi:hypothetical protein